MKVQNTKLNKYRNQKGFTLVESLIAISILMVALASPLTLAQKGISTAVLSRDQMTASFLAQDAIEAVKNIRDRVAISAPADRSVTDWLSGLRTCECTNTDLNCSNFQPGVGYCNIDTTVDLTDPSAIISGTITNDVNPLHLVTDSSSNAFIKYDLLSPLGANSVNSKFFRYINIRQSTTNPDEAAVNVRVSWISPIGTQTINIKNFIYNYAENIN